MSDVVLVDATALIALGSVGRVDLLANLDGDVLVPETVVDEVTTEPARTNVSTFLDSQQVTDSVSDEFTADAQRLLGDERVHGDVELVAGVRSHHADDRSVAVVSDDRRVRTVAEGLGATVTGTVGVVVRAVHEGMDPEDAKDLVREIDSHGLHMTGELREKAFELIDDAAGD
ncbi:hypothetical protein [Halobacterium noricense]|uniref:hypothetical protein n=1 Tax=Halobacterium noricense TaxID=223182 RepID=UPI001E2FACB7|nr:hypothetical protein [Halobacterium noricense]UHH25729.1 hypothetical protein LT974_02065 [Halobacterium noricense]